MRSGEIEETVIPQNPLDVLAQHLVSMAALDEWEIDEVEKLVDSAQPFAELSREQLENVLDMLDGRYPVRALRRAAAADRLGPHQGQRCAAARAPASWPSPTPARSPTAASTACTCPDGRRVGELDEEMVYEARPGQTFLLGASTWRIEEITRDRVIVTPAPGTPGRRARSGAATGSAARPSSARRSAPSPARR